MMENERKNSIDITHFTTSVFTKEVIREALFVDPEINFTFLKENAIAKKPVDTLVECLLLQQKEVLREMAQEYNIRITSSMNKRAIAEKLEEYIFTNFSSLITYLPTSNLDYLKKMYENNCSITKDNDLKLLDISHTNHLGISFLFYFNKTLTVVVPQELLPLLEKIHDENVYTIAHLHERIDAYAVSLSNLYGILDIDQFAIVWNRYEKETLTPAMIGDELAHLNKFQIFWWYEDEKIISTYFEDNDDVDEFLESVKDVSYYIPTFEELRQFFVTPYDKSSPAVHAMIDFLSEFHLEEKLEVTILMQQISDAILVGDGIQDVFDLLNEYGLYFHATDEISRFAQLFDDLDDTIRKWQLRGHRPSILKGAKTL
jgi:hypothetical protein